MPDLKSAISLAQLAKQAEEEMLFQDWYSKHAIQHGLDPNPDAPEHKYDYRSAYLSGQGPDESGHWPSQFKSDDHPRRFLVLNGVITDTKTGKPAK